MHFVVDSGNTLTKAAIFEGKNLIKLVCEEYLTGKIIDELLHQHPCSHSIVCDVSGRTSLYRDHLSRVTDTIFMDHLTPTPLINLYKSAETLGSDRLAAAVCGASEYPGKNVLVIQAGTCITYDMVSERNEYLGGAISPGIDMRLKALNTFTTKLPLVQKTEFTQLTGKTTSNSILSGIMNGCRAETDGMIYKFRKKFPDLIVVLGGGDIIFFDKRLKNRIFAVANLVLRGLNIILEHNK